jgi:hypothetical protein
MSIAAHIAETRLGVLRQTVAAGMLSASDLDRTFRENIVLLTARVLRFTTRLASQTEECFFQTLLSWA